MVSPVCVRSSYPHSTFTTLEDRTQALTPANPLVCLVQHFRHQRLFAAGLRLRVVLDELRQPRIDELRRFRKTEWSCSTRQPREPGAQAAPDPPVLFAELPVWYAESHET
jgi:hypothetical protein